MESLGPLGTKEFTEKTWGNLIKEISNGAKKDQLLKKMNISNATFQAQLISTRGASEQYQDARLVHIRRRWPLEIMEDLMQDIAMGCAMTEACEKRGIKLHRVHLMIERDPAIRQMYHEARRISMEEMGDDILRISDNVNLDGTTTTANSAKVNLARLQVAARQWLMSRLSRGRFGDRVTEDIEIAVHTDHATELDKARIRKEKAIEKKKLLIKQLADQDKNSVQTVH